MLRKLFMASLALAFAFAFALGLAVVAGFVLVDPNGYRGAVSELLAMATGRGVDIEGDLSLGFGWPPELRLGGLRVANTVWALRRIYSGATLDRRSRSSHAGANIEQLGLRLRRLDLDVW